MRKSTVFVLMLIMSMQVLAQENNIDKALANLLAMKAPSNKCPEFEAVLKAAGNDASKMIKAIKRDKSFPTREPGTANYNVSFAINKKKYSAKTTIIIPKEYSPEKSWPLLIALPPMGKDAKVFVKAFTGLLGSAADEYVILSMSMAGTDSQYSAMPYQEESLLAPLRQVCRLFNIDDDRIYITGYGLGGGDAAWHHAGVRPHVFGAAMPLSPLPYFRGFPYSFQHYMQNLKHLDVTAIWGELDKGENGKLGRVDFCRMAANTLRTERCKKFIGKELKGVGYGKCLPQEGEMQKFFSGKKRTSMPQSFIFNFYLYPHARAYYIKALKFTKRPISWYPAPKVVLSEPMPKDMKLQIRVVGKYYKRYMFRLIGKIDRTQNMVTAMSMGVSKMKIYIYDGMLDLDKPVKLKYPRKLWKGAIAASARCVLANYIVTRDSERPVLNEVIVTRGMKPEIMWK